MIVTTALDIFSNYMNNMQKNVSALRKCFNLSFEEPDIHNPLFNNGTTPLLKCYKSYEYITVYLSL